LGLRVSFAKFLYVKEKVRYIRTKELDANAGMSRRTRESWHSGLEGPLAFEAGLTPVKVIGLESQRKIERYRSFAELAHIAAIFTGQVVLYLTIEDGIYDKFDMRSDFDFLVSNSHADIVFGIILRKSAFQDDALKRLR
jgi:hypothetical protein